MPGAGFSDAYFTGKRCVSEALFPGGKPLTVSEIQKTGAGITLETS